MDALTLAVEATPNAVDWTTVLLALITGLVSIGTAVVSVFAARYASHANTSAQEARAQSSATAKAVDGVKTELMAAVEGKARAEGMVMGAAITSSPAPSPLPVAVVSSESEPVSVVSEADRDHRTQ